MSFQLWDFETGNALGEYEREADALAVVRENIRSHGPSVVQGVALLDCDARGKSRVVAQGEKLLQIVLQRTSPGV